MSARVGPSPRSDAEPMAFRDREFLRGAVAAWGWYLISMVIVSVMWLTALPYVLIFGVPVSAVALLAWSPFAYMLGTALRRVRRVSVHLIAFSLFGAIVGAITMMLFVGFMSGFQPSSWDGFGLYAPYALTPALAVPFAWWRTARRALRSDMGEAPVPRPDPDAAAEDAVVIRLTERTDEFDAR